MSEPPRTRLDQAMDRRRLDLRKQWKDIARDAGISTAALGAIRRGEYKPSPLTARGVEDALLWERGSIATTLEGGDPTAIEDAADRQQLEAEYRDPEVAKLAAELAEVKRANAEMKRRLDQIEGREEGRQHRQAR